MRVLNIPSYSLESLFIAWAIKIKCQFIDFEWEGRQWIVPVSVFHWPKPEKEVVVIRKQPLRGPTKSLYTVLTLYLFLG